MEATQARGIKEAVATRTRVLTSANDVVHSSATTVCRAKSAGPWGEVQASRGARGARHTGQDSTALGGANISSRATQGCLLGIFREAKLTRRGEEPCALTPRMIVFFVPKHPMSVCRGPLASALQKRKEEQNGTSSSRKLALDFPSRLRSQEQRARVSLESGVPRSQSPVTGSRHSFFPPVKGLQLLGRSKE